MTLYQGGKVRLGRHIHDAIVDWEKSMTRRWYASARELNYFEPFVGMAGVMRHFGEDVNSGSSQRRLLACDKNASVVAMWAATQQGWSPPTECSKEEYMQLKKSSVISPEKGYIGSACSFGGIYFGGYSSMNALRMSQANFNKVAQSLASVQFLPAASYDAFEPQDLTIYCDPPYLDNILGTKNPLFNFDHDHFWATMRRWSQKNIVVVSERAAPDDFVSIWSTQYKHMHRQQQGAAATTNTEQLFVSSIYFD